MTTQQCQQHWLTIYLRISLPMEMTLRYSGQRQLDPIQSTEQQTRSSVVFCVHIFYRLPFWRNER